MRSHLAVFKAVPHLFLRKSVNELSTIKIIRETVRQNFNLTEASAALYTSQSGVSKHIKDLEDELGVQLFVRKGKRLLGLTERPITP